MGGRVLASPQRQSVQQLDVWMTSLWLTRSPSTWLHERAWHLAYISPGTSYMRIDCSGAMGKWSLPQAAMPNTVHLRPTPKLVAKLPLSLEISACRSCKARTLC